MQDLVPDISIVDSTTATPSPSLRVCDRCIRKKVKCNRERPACSRCLELHEVCSYTSAKRKPGPTPGTQYTSSRKSRRPPRASLELDFQIHSDTPTPQSATTNLSTDGFTPALTDLASSSSAFTPSTIQQQAASGTAHSRTSYSSFPPQQVECLLERFFEILCDANPIFSKDLFLRRYHNGQCSDDLVSTVFVISAKLTGFTTTDDEDSRSTWDAWLDRLLSSSMLQDDLLDDSISLESLDYFRKAYLLAFYEFHQFPGHQSWIRVGRVTRMAYRIGLDRLDHIRTRYPDWSIVQDEDLQEWRTLWWCLYRLDTYSNMSCGTPYLIDDAVVLTSLIQPTRPSDNTAVPELHLPSSVDDMCKILLANPSLPVVHNITIATLRQAGLVLRLRAERSRPALVGQIAKAEQHLATIRLALPTGWLNPRRNALAGESHNNYYTRVATVLHLRMAQLLLAVGDSLFRQNSQSDTTDSWVMARWQRVLEACQDIAAVAEQWDSTFCLTVDPALAFIVFTALAFLALHQKMHVVTDDVHPLQPSSDLRHQITVLHLQLRHLANIWTVPKLLKLSYESFYQSIPAPISSQYVALILSRFEAPFHPKWMQFLSSAHTDNIDS